MNLEKTIKQEVRARLKIRAITKKARKDQKLLSLVALGAVLLGYRIALNVHQPATDNHSVTAAYASTTNNGTIAVSGGSTKGFDFYEPVADKPETTEPPPPLPPMYEDTI